MLRFRQLAFYGPSSRELAPSAKPSFYPRMPERASRAANASSPFRSHLSLQHCKCAYILTNLFWVPSADGLVTRCRRVTTLPSLSKARFAPPHEEVINEWQDCGRCNGKLSHSAAGMLRPHMLQGCLIYMESLTTSGILSCLSEQLPSCFFGTCHCTQCTASGSILLGLVNIYRYTLSPICTDRIEGSAI